MQIDFSGYTDEVLKGIEKAANVAKQHNYDNITPCHLLVGFTLVAREAVVSYMTSIGVDINATMQIIADKVTSLTSENCANGVSFDSDVEDLLCKLSTRDEMIDITVFLKELLNQNDGPLKSVLIPSCRYSDCFTTTGETIKKFCTNMIEMAAKGKYNHAIGREDEIQRVLMILSRATKNNPVLVGEPGTGKTAIAEELAIRLLNNNVPSAGLSRLKLYSLDFATIKSLPDSVGVMKTIIEEATEDSNLILFIDEVHMLISAHSSSDNDIANLMKPAMARGDVKIFGATTIDEYKRIEKDPAFERRFQKIDVREPDSDSAIQIIIGAKKRIEKHHDIVIPDEVCKSSVVLSVRYITNRKLPDKAIDILDEAAADLRIHGTGRKELTESDVLKVIAKWTGIPVGELGTEEKHRLQNLRQELESHVVGQNRAIEVVSNAIIQSRAGFGNPTKPIGSFLFLGTTGTGKTELAKAVAKFLFNDSKNMVRIDMSEYQQEHSSHRLFGAPPGYVGYEQGGQLTEAVYRKPYSVILFDEIEKAHPKIYENLLQVLDDGRMTDGKGKVVDFTNTIIIMTSNIGQSTILNTLCGHTIDEGTIESCTNNVMAELKHRVSPEFLNRIDKVVMFNPLSKDDIMAIATITVNEEIKKFKEKGYDLVIDPSIISLIAEKGYEPANGGRPVKRAVNEYITQPLVTSIINGELVPSLPVYLSVENNIIVFKNGTTTRI